MQLPQVRRTGLIALCTATLLAAIPSVVRAQTDQVKIPKETKAQYNARMHWWTDARFGMFIHWGIYSVPAHAEWYMSQGHVPRDKYAKYATQFDPVKFDADTWAEIAHDAGQKYLVITSKHHDGFSMFDTKATDYNVVKATPWGKDPLKLLSEACKRHGIKFCVYYSIMDWHTPFQGAADPDPVHPTYNPTHFKPGDKELYIEYMKTQLKELVTQYHPGVIWFDGGWMNGWTADDGRGIYAYLRKLDPKLIINNRVGGAGDYETPEQNIPATGLGKPWETCMTINGSWGYNATDPNFKTPETLLHNLIDCASKGGNYLLNVGPTDQGIIPEQEVQALKAMGDWLKVNGDSIYGTTASPFKQQMPWGRITRSDNTLYLNVFDWPTDGKLAIPGLKNQVDSATLLATSQKLTAETGDDGVTITLPATAPDAISSCIKLQLKGNLDVENPMLTQAADGTLTLPAAQAVTHGQVHYESGNGKDNLGYWIDPADWVEWQFKTVLPGKYDLTAQVATAGTGSFEVKVAGQTLKATAPNTGDYTTFQTLELGTVQIKKAGKATLQVKPVKKGWSPVNLKSITFKPAG